MIKKINYVFYDDSGAAGGATSDFNINVDPVALRNAAGDYLKAVEAYKTARDAVKADLNAVLEAWDDSSKEVYQARVELALGELDAIEATLNLNSTNLGKIATYAEETEANVKTGVESISVTQ